jgi:hypothetical protein
MEQKDKSFTSMFQYQRREGKGALKLVCGTRKQKMFEWLH